MMKQLILCTILLLGLGSVFAAAEDDKRFADAYDRQLPNEAAQLLKDADLDKPSVARRAGVMYYTGKGVERDRDKGKALLTRAMLNGEAEAAVNLVKIYMRSEPDPVPASRALLRAIRLCGAEDTRVSELKRMMGDTFLSSLDDAVLDLEKRCADNREAVARAVSLRDRLASADARLKASEAQLKQNQAAYRDSLARMGALEEASGKRLREAERTITSLRERVAGLEKVRTELTEAKTLLDEREKRIRGLESVSDALAEAEKELRVRDERIRQLRTAESNLVKSQREAESLSRQVQVQTKTIAELEKQIASAEKETDILTREISRLRTLQSKLKESEAETAELKKKLLAAHLEIRTFRSEKERLADGIRRLEGALAEIERLKAVNAALQSAVDSGEKQTAGKNRRSGSAGILKGVSRGAATLLMSPLNLLRTFPYVQHVSNEEGAPVALVSFPVVAVMELLPTGADIVNGTLDVLSLGIYGNRLYDSRVSPRFYERNNEGVPWIDCDFRFEY